MSLLIAMPVVLAGRLAVFAGRNYRRGAAGTYYLTTENQAFTPIRKALTTPVVLKNGLVVGWGDTALQRAVAQRQEVPAATWGRGLPNP